MRKILPLIIAVMLVIPAFGAGTAQAAGGKTIVDIAAGDRRFTTLVAAVKAAGLVNTLSGPGPFTVFAPTNAAFAKLPAGTVAALLKDIPTLTGILTYHVVSGAVPAGQVVGLQSAGTVQGSPIQIRVRGGSVILNGTVKVIITDIVASNGIIHVIDTVLLPPVTGQNQLVLVNRTVPLLSEPGGEAIGLSLSPCKTVFITQTVQGTFGQIRDIGGWIDLRNTANVAANYGQPGGQPVVRSCVGQ
jgi:uncharacterized surface protein with fasciclin (FAS1) repeats